MAKTTKRVFFGMESFKVLKGGRLFGTRQYNIISYKKQYIVSKVHCSMFIGLFPYTWYTQPNLRQQLL